MSDVVIRAEGLGKKYLIGHQSKERYSSLRDVLAQQARGMMRSARDMAAGRALVAGDEREEFWALKDVNFEIKRGEVVGIIGRNGAGKSTLLKVLSRITEPSEGRITLNGRVASLLEVGTGFHPELTGRENIYLNGAILGMTRAEIRRKFDEIVDFAGVEKFLDTPVKRYSSGMYVRLAFSVAAHLEPEILVVDEVLAVGDAEFQKKCLGKMQDVAGAGRTVLFVSHNMAAVQALCGRAIALEQGRKSDDGITLDVIEKYLAKDKDVETNLKNLSGILRKGNGALKFERIELRSGNEESYVPGLKTGSQAIFALTVAGSRKKRGSARIGIGLSDNTGRALIHLANEVLSDGNIMLGDGDTLEVSLRDFPLFSGSYLLNLFLEVDGQIEDWIANELWIEVDDGSFFGTGRNAPIGWEGKTVLVKSDWRVTKNPASLRRSKCEES